MCFATGGQKPKRGLWRPNHSFRELPNVIRPLEPATLAVFMVKLVGNFFLHERDETKRLEAYETLQEARVVSFLFRAMEHLKSAPDAVFAE